MNILRSRYLPGGLTLIALVLLLQVTPVLAAQNPNPGVLPPDSHPFGKTYGEWSNAWWQWAYSIPVPNNPVLDTTGANCSVGQSGNVWFLAGTFNSGETITRTCTVPHGKALFVPIFNSENDNIGVTPPLTADQLRAALNAFFKCCVDPSTFSAEVDGVAIQQLGNYRAGQNNPVFSFMLPVKNVYPGSPPAGTYSPVVSDGYYLMLAPLSTGTHTIHFVALSGGQDVTYTLTIGS